ncbi:hypothetical protein PtB15_1B996 [Puccinia triticina]|nr:hypothetical protein PtB15_1B996 [Puccinia triticina]
MEHSKPHKKRKRIPPTSDSDQPDPSHRKSQKPPTSPDVEIMASPQQTAEHPKPSPAIPSTSQPRSQPPPLTNYSEQLKQTLKSSFKFLILDGPAFHSNHQALTKMVESAQELLVDDPDETIYQNELDQKSSDLKDSEDAFDTELNTAATPLVDGLTQFIQAQVERQLKLRLEDALRAHLAHLARLEKKFDQKLKNLQTKPNTADLDKWLETKLDTLKAQIDQANRDVPDKIVQELEKKQQSQAENQLQLQKKLDEIEATHQKRFDHLQSKLANIEASLLNKQRPQLGPIEEKSPENESSDHTQNTGPAAPKPSSPETARSTSAGNALKLTLSPHITTNTTQPAHPTIRHRSTSQSQAPNNNNRPKPLKPAGVSAEPGGSPPRPSTALADRPPPPSDSPINNTTSNHHPSSAVPPPASAEAYYNYISTRLMKSSWLLEYSKEKLTDFYKQQIPQDITHHLDQLGLTSNRVSELLSLLNLLPDLDFGFISKTGTSSSMATPITPGSAQLTHFHALPAPPIHSPVIPINSLQYPPPISMAAVPTNFNLVENFSLSYLKDILGVMSYHVNHMKIRLDRFEIRLSNDEKLGIDHRASITNLLKRMDSIESQTSQLANSKASSEDLSQLDARVTCAQREAKESGKKMWDLALKSNGCKSPRSVARSLVGHPQASSAGSSTHASCLSMAKIEHQILDRLFAELRRLVASASSAADSATDKPAPKEREKGELEEGETSGEEDEFKDTIESILTDDRNVNPQTNNGGKTGDPSGRWKALAEMARSQYQQCRQKEKETLTSNQTSTIDSLRIGALPELENLQSAGVTLAERRREEIFAEQSVSGSAPSLQPPSATINDIPVHPQTNAASTST